MEKAIQITRLSRVIRAAMQLFREKGYIAGYIVAAQGLGILLVGLLAAILVAMIVYFIACLLLRVKELGYVIVAIAERFKRRRTA